jgi:hypothetical protein
LDRAAEELGAFLNHLGQVGIRGLVTERLNDGEYAGLPPLPEDLAEPKNAGKNHPRGRWRSSPNSNMRSPAGAVSVALTLPNHHPPLMPPGTTAVFYGDPLGRESTILRYLHELNRRERGEFMDGSSTAKNGE